MSSSNCCFLTFIQVSHEVVRWSGIPISLWIFQFVMIHTVRGFSTVNESEVDVFLKFPCFLFDSMDIGSLIYGSSAFSKSNLNILKLLFHILLKPSLKDFKHYLTNIWNECYCVVVWTFFCIALLWDCNENWPFCSPVSTCWVFQICWHIECSTFIALSFRIWNSSAGIPSPPLALCIVMLPKAHLTSDSTMSNYTIVVIWVIKIFFFLYNSSVYSCLENPRDGRAWWAAIYGVTQSRTRLKQLCSSSSSKVTFHAKMGTIKDRNIMDLTEAKD